MSRNGLPPNEIILAVAECLDILGTRPESMGEDLTSTPIPSLLQQINLKLSSGHRAGRRPIGCISHFACVGGTLISRCVAAMPNILVLSEMDPLSMFGLNPERPVFSPTDLLRHLRYSRRTVPEQVIISTYRAAISEAQRSLGFDGVQLVVRDHSHSHFCTGVEIDSRPTHLDVLRAQLDVRPIVTVRDPVESYISLTNRDWESYEPKGFDEYCRRYLLFLDRHAGIPVFKYEAFVRDPGRQLAEICDALEVDFVEGAEELISVIRLTGDSGRGGSAIEVRPARLRSAELQEAISASIHYPILKSRLDY
jgi:hypothetical protein